MVNYIEGIKKKMNGRNDIKIVVPEGDEIRIIKSLKLTPEIIKVLLGDRDDIVGKIKVEYGNDFDKIMEKVEIVDTKEFETKERLELLIRVRKGKVTEEEAKVLLTKRPYVAAIMLKNNEVSSMVGGSFYSSKDILKSAFQIIGMAPGEKLISANMLMEKDGDINVFSDCAINLNPTADQLKNIALQTAKTAKMLGLDPLTAMLSYSTMGSGAGPDIEIVQEACKLLDNEDINYIGEIQFDAAWNSDIRKIKTQKDTPKPNVFIFPNLNAGNIGYKIAEQMGGWNAVGPFLQGIDMPVTDLSRGTTPEIIAQVMYLTSIGQV